MTKLTTKPTSTVNESFAYNVGKDIANLEHEVELLKALPKGAEVLKIDVPKTELTQFGQIRASAELPDSFKNSICLKVRFGSTFEIITILDSFEFNIEDKVIYLIKLSSAADMIKSTGVLNAEDIKAAEQERQRQEQERQRQEQERQRQEQERQRQELTYLFIAKYLTDHHLKQMEGKYGLGRTFVNKNGLNAIQRTPFEISTSGEYVSHKDNEAMVNVVKDVLAKIESGEYDVNTAKGFKVPYYVISQL